MKSNSTIQPDSTVLDYLASLTRIEVAGDAPPVCRTVAGEIQARFAPRARVTRPSADRRRRQGPTLALEVDAGRARTPEVRFEVNRYDQGRLTASHTRFLYAWFTFLTEVRGHEPLASFAQRQVVHPAFQWQRPIFDLYFTQSARTVRGLDRETYAQQMARFGFTHLEVNGLAGPEPVEAGEPGEVYPRFYTYCPALDQFTTSFLNRGTYPADYLRANLARLKENARLAQRFGLTPVLLCFEPRSVPDALLRKYPELRGARVDHPFRSFRPRFNLAVSHPVVRRHYREMIQKLLKAVPELGCLAIWTNDSGAGLEYTRSLYVGANGSAYLVREWSEEDVFSRAAARNAVGFLRLLQESAAEINPEFRVTARLEPFGPEREHVLAGLGRGLDVEVPTLLATGWESPYRHPRYRDSDIGPFTIFNNAFLPEEKAPMAALARRDCLTHVMYAHGPTNNFEPLLGIPAPWLTHEKIHALHEVGAEYLAHMGGIAPPASVPCNVNEEIFRRFQFNPGMDVDATVADLAREWAGPDHAAALVEAWQLTDRAIRAFMPNPLYFQWGVWYRIFIRPLVPDLEAIPERERAYYETHMLSTHHNPNRVDLSRDVLFHLMTPPIAARAVSRIDRHARPPLEEAVAVLRKALSSVKKGKAGADAARVLRDQADRLEALACWFTTRRNVAAWIANVHGYLESKDSRRRTTFQRELKTMVTSEIANIKRLQALWQQSKVPFLALSEGKETTFIYDGNFGRHLARKIQLMKKYGNVKPRIDADIQWRVRSIKE